MRVYVVLNREFEPYENAYVYLVDCATSFEGAIQCAQEHMREQNLMFPHKRSSTWEPSTHVNIQNDPDPYDEIRGSKVYYFPYRVSLGDFNDGEYIIVEVEPK